MESTQSSAASSGKRKKLVAAVVGAFAVSGIVYGAYWALVTRHQEFTDDAYVDGNIVQVTPRITGTVVAIGAETTDIVRAGQVLVQIDSTDARVAMDEAEAQLAKSVRQVRNLFATSSQLQTNVEMRVADLAKAKADLARREALQSSGAVSAEDVNHARESFKAAQAALAGAREQAAANLALVDETTVRNHPDVRKAAANLENAFLAYQRTQVPAPIGGMVTRRSVQLGQRVSPGAPLMAVVPLEQVWVNANFKEPQLAHVRIGQPAKLSADIYGGKVEYDGRVIGVDAGTGSAFSLLPAQNATGNWIKVVQRVPVRIALDPQQLAEHPLRIGLSMQVTVDSRSEPGGALAFAPRTGPVYKTPVFEGDRRSADDLVARIVRSNGGRA